MGFGMNAHEEEVNKKYDNVCNNMAQAHLAQQTMMSNMSNSNDRTDTIQQQLNSKTWMFQHTMNLAVSKPPLPTYQMPMQQQQFQP